MGRPPDPASRPQPPWQLQVHVLSTQAHAQEPGPGSVSGHAPASPVLSVVTGGLAIAVPHSCPAMRPDDIGHALAVVRPQPAAPQTPSVRALPTSAAHPKPAPLPTIVLFVGGGLELPGVAGGEGQGQGHIKAVEWEGGQWRCRRVLEAHTVGGNGSRVLREGTWAYGVHMRGACQHATHA